MFSSEYLTILFAENTTAVCIDDEGNLWYTEIPEEFAVPGEVTEHRYAHPFSELPSEIAERYISIYKSMPDALIDSLLFDGLEGDI